MDEMQYDMLTLKSICAEKVRVFNIFPLCTDLKSAAATVTCDHPQYAV